MISAIILVKNEENSIASVLKKLSWIDEHIIINNGSIDRTEDVARKLGATVITVPQMDFSVMRTTGAKKATHDWILYIDTDEEIPEELQKEIKTITHVIPHNTECQAYTIKRKNFYLHRPWPYSDGMIRLIYKPSLEGWFGRLHETATITGNVGVLKNVIYHHTHRSLEEMLEKTNEWSNIEADLRYESNHPPIVAWRFFRVMGTGFYESYIRQQGWKVGTEGLIEAIYQAFSMYVTYVKLWEKQIHI